MGVLFSVLITLAFGLVFNSVQSNTITESFNTAFGVNRLVIGIILTVLTALIIFGGIHRIAKVTEVLVPVMALAYIGIAVIILIMNATLGGALLLGIKRGLFSNEAGMGSAPNAAATANVTHPVKQGLIQTLGVFTDTLIICSCTAFIILLSGVDYSGPNASTGIKLTQDALSSQIGPFGNTFIAICILLFAFSSIVGNYYYGESNIEFLNDKKWFLFAYRVCVVLMVLFGSVAKVDVVWNLADVFMGLMAIVNLIAIFMLSKYAFLALRDYTEQKKSGIKEPVFKASSIPGLKNAKEWE